MPETEYASLHVRVPADLIEEARNAQAHLAGAPDYLRNMGVLLERALRNELTDLLEHHGLKAWPKRPQAVRK